MHSNALERNVRCISIPPVFYFVISTTRTKLSEPRTSEKRSSKEPTSWCYRSIPSQRVFPRRTSQHGAIPEGKSDKAQYLQAHRQTRILYGSSQVLQGLLRTLFFCGSIKLVHSMIRIDGPLCTYLRFNYGAGISACRDGAEGVDAWWGEPCGESSCSRSSSAQRRNTNHQPINCPHRPQQ